MLSNKELSALGLAKRAGKLVSGTQNVLEAVRGKKALLVLIASGVSENTRKMLADKTSSYHVSVRFLPFGMEALGHAVGKNSAACAALTDENFVRLFENAGGSESNTRKE